MNKRSIKILEVTFLVIILIFLSFLVEASNIKNNEQKNKELISINLKNVELETALIMLANTAEKNIICDSAVKGKITVIFNDILFEDALNLITDSFDLNYNYQKNVIYVSTVEKIAAQNKKLTSKNYNFNYLSSEMAAEILKENFDEINVINLNSEGIIVNAVETDFKKIDKLISQIDKAQKQVMINARVEEISRTKIKELGINPNELSELKIIKNKNGDLEKLKASWPDTLKAMNEQGLSKILANPSLMTLDRKKAKLIIGDQIPVKLERVEDEQTVSTINYIEAGIVLEFLPKIINDNQLILEVKPSVNSLGQVLADGLPAVNSRSAETTVILEDGETLAIGGLIKKDELKTIKELPVLAELPILGHFFKSDEKQNIETELIIFITPKIIKNKQPKISNQSFTNKGKSDVKNNKIKNKKKENSGYKENKNNKSFINLTESELKEILEN